MTDSPADFLMGYSPFTNEPIYDPIVFGDVMADPGRIVGRTRLTWKQKRFVMVSTVSLPRIPEDPDRVFETMIIGEVERLPGPLNTIDFGNTGGRYDSLRDAIAGHKAWCRLVAGWLMVKGRHTVTWHEETTW